MVIVQHMGASAIPSYFHSTSYSGPFCDPNHENQLSTAKKRACIFIQCPAFPILGTSHLSGMVLGSGLVSLLKASLFALIIRSRLGLRFPGLEIVSIFCVRFRIANFGPDLEIATVSLVLTQASSY
jgi:hypothetical protein